MLPMACSLPVVTPFDPAQTPLPNEQGLGPRGHLGAGRCRGLSLPQGDKG